MRTFFGVYKWWLSLLISAVLLSGCGGGSGTAPSTISGTAATGAPIVGGSVTVTCAGGNALTTNTANDGAWSVTISGQTLPCAIQVTGGTINGVANVTPYHSIALALGIANITPLTDLIVANLAGNNDPAAWFSGLNAAAIQQINSAALNLALGNLRTALNLAALNNINPLTMAFQAATGDPLDDILEALSAALGDANTNYAALLNAAANQSFMPPNGLADAFAAAHAQMQNGGAGGGGGGGDFAALPAGLSSKVFDLTYQNAQAGSPFSNGTVQKFTFSGSHMLFLGEAPERNLGFSTKVGSEYIWFDAANSIAYAVSLKQDGTLNEINVAGSANGTPWYGQYAPDADAGAGGAGGAGGASATPTIDFAKCTLHPNGNYLCTPDALASFGPTTISNTGTATTCTISYNGSDTMVFLGGGRSASLPVAQLAVSRYPAGGPANVILTSGRMSFHIGASNQIDYVQYLEPNYASVTCLDVNNQ